MIMIVLSVLLLVALAWSFGFGAAAHAPNPEDDVTTPIDRAALAEAERELLEDGGARPIGDELEDEDWGPGTGGKSGLPGLF